MVDLNLTESEQTAKEQMYRILTEASKKPCDVGPAGEIEARLPRWYNDSQFKRGKKYFTDNRFGMMQSNLCGLVSLLREPKGLKILHSTGKSSNKETARRRYISTILHMLSWYEVDLSPGSKSWESLNRVRKLHLFASNSAMTKQLGYISQSELSLTTFGFMGYAILKPHLMGIKYDNDKDREGFIHFWAVMGHMLGVEDQYNICLHSLEVVIKICEICLRYLFLPLLQIEIPLSMEMVSAVTDGMEMFLPFTSYESTIFTVKRIAGVPGYQFDVDLEKENLIKSYFTLDELNHLKAVSKDIQGYEYISDVILEEKMVLLDIKRHADQIDINHNIADHLDNMDESVNVPGVYRQMSGTKLSEETTPLHELLGLKFNDEINFIRIEDPNDWKTHLNQSEFDKLSSKHQHYVKMTSYLLKKSESGIGKYVCEAALSLALYRMKNYKG